MHEGEIMDSKLLIVRKIEKRRNKMDEKTLREKLEIFDKMPQKYSTPRDTFNAPKTSWVEQKKWNIISLLKDPPTIDHTLHFEDYLTH